MSIAEDKKTNGLEKFSAYIGYIALIALAVVAFWKLGNVWIEKVVSKQQEQVSQTIINTVNQQAKLSLLMPDVVFINLDSTHKKQINDSISKQIATILTKKYIYNEKINPSDINFQPYFVFPDSANNKGNYILTKVQLEELKNNIQFLTSQVDKAVTATKDEINNELERINTWVSIWIGVISIFGILIPLFYNYKNNKDLEQIKDNASEAKSKADEAKLKADEAFTLIDTHKGDIESVKGVISELGTLKQSFGDFKGEVDQAKSLSDKALITATAANLKATKLEKLVSTLNDISKIKDIDSNFLLYNHQPLETLKRYLQEIYTNLSNCVEIFDEPIIKDTFRQLALKLHLIAPYDFISPTNFDLLNQFALGVSNIIGVPLTQETYIQALTLLNTLNSNLNNE